MPPWRTPRVLLTDFAWPNNIPEVPSDQILPTPVHYYLRLFSHSCCNWVGITRIEEVLTMKVARQAGLPVPKVICYKDRPDTPHAPWKRPWGGKRICSLIGTPIRSTRVPDHRIGPFETEKDFNEYLIEPGSPGEFRSKREYKEALRCRVQDGRITGLLDWEAAGWYRLILTVGGMDYMLKLEIARALTSLTSESCSW
ncbi:hypothetical protein BO79DRAFT_228129 [Aspergillus costaricaensis CBS 115574]|uniref:Uncharacterized protein n=1 Tax=Aspergillus costaricaensis CBS 115574 TaxID=1448317 RepID=A0ACD1IG87_9EURO|nr:hypothetical protein BO79DRAFT_228129 [Aspergillus costaricaensis CBS 115574]RAK89295.1 hypothetical protein BO79DRAFT_228129 [Aspergillus costaricaensis CBS 115574]